MVDHLTDQYAEMGKTVTNHTVAEFFSIKHFISFLTISLTGINHATVKTGVQLNFATFRIDLKMVIIQ